MTISTARRGSTRRLLASLTGALLLTSGVAGPSEAGEPLPACTPGASAPRTVATVELAGVPAWLEGFAIDSRGRAFVTTPYTGQVLRIDAPGAKPVALTPARLPIDPAAITGGLTFLPDGRLVGVTGVLPPAALLPLGRVVEIDPDTGKVTTLAAGINGGNGVTVGPDGSLYITSSVVGSVERVSPDGRVTHSFSRLSTPNGIAVSADGQHLYVAQMLAPGGSLVRRVSIATGRTEEWIKRPSSSLLPVADGLTTDPLGRLVLATGIAGQLWRIDPVDRAVCTLEPGGWLPATQAAYGRGRTGFSQGNLYRVGETGVIQEVPAGRVG